MFGSCGFIGFMSLRVPTKSIKTSAFMAWGLGGYQPLVSALFGARNDGNLDNA